jgi:hypothetical protein
MGQKQEQAMIAAVSQQLHPGEQLRYWAYGVKQPNMGLIILLIALAILPGIIAVALLTKQYVVGLTDGRLLVLQVGGGAKVKQVMEFDRAQLAGKVSASKGAIFTHLAIKDGGKTTWKAKFHRAGASTNREHSQAMADALAPARQLAA